jgi:starch phosphorylase
MNAPFICITTLSIEALKHSIAYKLMFTIGKDPVIANNMRLNATLLAAIAWWNAVTLQPCTVVNAPGILLSMEFLIGRNLPTLLPSRHL